MFDGRKKSEQNKCQNDKPMAFEEFCDNSYKINHTEEEPRFLGFVNIGKYFWPETKSENTNKKLPFIEWLSLRHLISILRTK